MNEERKEELKAMAYEAIETLEECGDALALADIANLATQALVSVFTIGVNNANNA